ncbi:MAG: class I SAM-dependent methyltransferase [Alphaproteobacteria bacterium]|nr:methyltransferase domain-containing protein [Alphaproteobacteria bacterium]MDE2337193.1 class I SAM-dependent methyltransferase [Alphaproteobacteria bacterium]
MAVKLQSNYGVTAKDYAQHRAGFPASFFARLEASGLFSARRRVLDLGTGTGTLARGFAKRGHDVTGLDISPDMMAQARALGAAEGVNVSYVEGRSEKIPFADASFDIVTAGQCFHWFDREKTSAEIARVLRPEGLFAIGYFDWVRKPGNPVDVMYALREKHNPGWEYDFPLGFYPEKPGDLTFAGFASRDRFIYEEDVPYTHEGWRGRIRAYAGVGGSLPKDRLEKFDAEFAAALAEKFPDGVMRIPHKVWAEIWRKEAV